MSDKPQLKVFYDGYDKELEKELDALLEKHGWHRWASGINHEARIRDIAYEKDE